MRTFRVLALGSVSLLSLSLPAQAQEVPAATQESATAPAQAGEPENFDGEIVVRARRRDEIVADVPLTVNAVTSATIEKFNLRNFQEITSIVPGLSLTPNANGIGSSSSLRGVNQDVNVSAENGTVQFYFNDAPVPSNFVLQSMYDVAQVEVLRGPQGTLRGRSTPSGSITVSQRQPDLDEVGATVIGTLSDKHAANLQFGINVPVIADKLAVRVAGLVDRNRGNDIRSVNSSITPLNETNSIRASVRAAPLDWLHGGFVYQALDVNSRSFDQVVSFSNFVPGYAPKIDESLVAGNVVISPPLASQAQNAGTIGLGDRLSVATAPRKVAQNLKFYGWNLDLDVAGQSLIYVGSHVDARLHALTNQDVGATFPTQTLFQDALTTTQNTTHEIRLQNQERVLGLFDYVVGYFRQAPSSDSVTSLTNSSLLHFYAPTPFGLIGLPNAAVPVPVPALLAQNVSIYIPRSKLSEQSFFGNLVFHIGEKTELSGGLRRIEFKSDSQGLYIGCTAQTFAAGTCVQAPGSELDYDVKNTIYNASIKHRFSDSLMVYAMTGTSARPPVRAVGDFSVAPSPLELKHISLPEETSTSYEIGLKSQWFDRKLRFNLTGYHQTFENYPYRAATGIYFININASGQAERSQFNFVSAVPVEVNGVESEISFAPSKQLSLSASINYADSRIKDSMLACTDVNGDGVHDVAVPTLSQLQAAYGAEHIAECPSTGQSATFLPKLSGSFQADATLPLTAGMDGYARGLVSWRGKSELDPGNPYDDVDAYGLVNLYFGLRDPRGAWDLAFFAKNLFDTTRIASAESSPYSTAVTYVNVATQRPIGSASYQSYYSGVTVTPPRELGVTLRVSLGSR